MQRLAEPACYLVHYCLRYIAGGIAAEQPEHARTAQVSLQAGLAGDHVEVKVLKAFRFGEQRDVGLAAADHIPQCGADGFEQWSQIRCFAGGEVIERDGMTPRDEHQPAGQRRAECVGNAPSRAQVDPLSYRQICPRITGTAHALLVSRHEPHCPRNAFPLPSGKSARDREAALRGGRGQDRRGWRRAYAMLMTAMAAQISATKISWPVLTELVVVITDPCKGPRLMDAFGATPLTE